MRQQVVVVVPDGGSLFEIATPLRVWGRDPAEPAWPDVELVACGVPGRQVTAAVTGLRLGGLAPLRDHVAAADIVVVPTWPVGEHPVPPALVRSLLEAHERGARIVGLCLGAFVVAETGLLDGRSAVTHWRYGPEFERRFPRVRLDTRPLYVDHGSVVTSAGSAAALDCCLHLVRTDHGAEAAAVVARSLVTAPHRAGSQSQFAGSPPLLAADEGLAAVLAEAAADIGAVPDVEALATLAATSRRSLERAFRSRLGITPRTWLADQRVQAARRLLEQTDLSVDQVAARVGFGSAAALRREFARSLAVTPSAYRRSFPPAAATARERDIADRPSDDPGAPFG